MLWYNRNMAKTSKAQIRSVQKYDRENTISFHWKLNRKTDADIVQRLDEVQNKSAYLKKLVRADIKEKDKE